MSAYRWKPIEDLPEDWQDMVADELQSLASIWIEQSARLKASEALKRFNDQLRRQWAIETGIIENLYSIDRGTTVLLIEKGIEASLIPHGAIGQTGGPGGIHSERPGRSLGRALRFRQWQPRTIHLLYQTTAPSLHSAPG